MTTLGVWMTAAVMWLAGCTVAPLVTQVKPNGVSPLRSSGAAREISVAADDGTVLRGLLVESEVPNGFVVLHLLPSRTSIDAGLPVGIGRLGPEPMIEAFAAQGFASLAFDYRGVGASDGRADASLLLDDGAAIWRRAVELADGCEGRVIIRACSLGALVATDLLAQGAKPAGVILFAPVSSKTVVRHAARHHRGPVFVPLSTVFVRSPQTPPLEAVLASTSVPVLALLAADDPYLPRREAEQLRAVLDRSVHTARLLPLDHQTLVLRAWGLVIESSEEGFAGQITHQLLEDEQAFLNSLRAWNRAPKGP